MATLTDTDSGTATFGDLEVRRLGYGAMRVTGDGIWGPPADHDAAIAVLRRTVELGVNLIDTADSYGPHVSEELIAEALHPYPSDLVIATKGGLERTGPGKWPVNGRPEHLEEACEGSLRRLRLDCIDVYQLHSPDDRVPYEESVGALAELRAAGKVRHVGVSNVSVEELATAQSIVPVVSVQNRYNLGDRKFEEVLAACSQQGLPFLPWYPLGAGRLEAEALESVARKHDATVHQVAIAWLLAKDPVIVPIPGTGSSAHLEENVAAAQLRLDAGDLEALESAGG